MRVLILTCNTGQGHNAAGLALHEALVRRGIEAEIRDTLSFSGQTTSELISGAYMKIATDVPWLFGTMYRAGDFVSSAHVKSPVYFANTRYAADLGAYIRARGVDAVLCPHLFPAEALTYLRHRGEVGARCYAVATDYTCVPFWEETDMDMFFIPHETLRAEFREKGIANDRLAATGIPVSERFTERTDAAAARAALGLPQDVPVALVMTGSMGFGHTVSLVERIAPSGASILVMTGKNEHLRAQVEALFGGTPQVKAIPFTDQVPLYMDACDVLLSKPGGLSSTEAAVRNVPLVHTEAIPGCETRNAAFFERFGLSVCAADAGDAAIKALCLMLNKPWQERMRAAQRETINPRAADQIVDIVLERG